MISDEKLPCFEFALASPIDVAFVASAFKKAIMNPSEVVTIGMTGFKNSVKSNFVRHLLAIDPETDDLTKRQNLGPVEGCFNEVPRMDIATEISGLGTVVWMDGG